jgi:hypothetical protein
MTGAIPTIYNRVRYRSRLEARWAIMFDWLGWKHQYEPIDGHGYIPDFILPDRERPLIVEVKPVNRLEEYWDPVSKMLLGMPDWKGDFLVLGTEPYLTCEHGRCHSLGLYIYYDYSNPEKFRAADRAWIVHNTENHHDYLKPSYTHGSFHTKGTHFMLNPDMVKKKWLEAGNTVQWQPKR